MTTFGLELAKIMIKSTTINDILSNCVAGPSQFAILFNGDGSLLGSADSGGNSDEFVIGSISANIWHNWTTLCASCSCIVIFDIIMLVLMTIMLYRHATWRNFTQSNFI